MNKCLICDDEQMTVTWTDTHGVAVCYRCGCPYKLYHYDENDKRIEKPRECLILEPWRPLIRKAWAELKINIAPGYGCIPNSPYNIAKPDDYETFNNWVEAHRDEYPQSDTSSFHD